MDGPADLPNMDGPAELPHMDVLSAESGTLAPPPLQPPPDVSDFPETGSEAQGSPAAPTTALGTAAAGSLAAPMKAFIDAFESEEGKAELRKLFHSIDTDGSGVANWMKRCLTNEGICMNSLRSFMRRRAKTWV